MHVHVHAADSGASQPAVVLHVCVLIEILLPRDPFNLGDTFSERLGPRNFSIFDAIRHASRGHPPSPSLAIRRCEVNTCSFKIVLHRITLTGANDIGVENQEIWAVLVITKKGIDNRNLHYEYTITLGYQTPKKYKARVQ